jgi:hypothetical protein
MGTVAGQLLGHPSRSPFPPASGHGTAKTDQSANWALVEPRGGCYGHFGASLRGSMCKVGSHLFASTNQHAPYCSPEQTA